MRSHLIRKLLPLVLFCTVAFAPPVAAGQQDTGPAVTQSEGGRGSDDVKQPSSLPFARTELFFGTNRPDGQPPVSDEEFREFLDREITPRFPDGLTLVSAFGQFRNASGTIVQERSLLLVLLYPAETQKASSRKIERIRTAYKRQFQQESVLRVDDPMFVWASF
jgi:hypothetical protein